MTRRTHKSSQEHTASSGSSRAARHRPQPRSPSHHCLPHSSFISRACTGGTAFNRRRCSTTSTRAALPLLLLLLSVQSFRPLPQQLILVSFSRNLFGLSRSCLAILAGYLFSSFLFSPFLFFFPFPLLLALVPFTGSLVHILTSLSCSSTPSLLPVLCHFPALCHPSHPVCLPLFLSSFHFTLRLFLDGGERLFASNCGCSVAMARVARHCEVLRVCMCVWQADDCLLPALVSRTPIAFLCGSRGKKKNETPEIAPLHTDPLALAAELSKKHTHRQMHAQTTAFCLQQTPLMLMTSVTPCVHTSAHRFIHLHGCMCVCVSTVSLRRLCWNS